ncbi:MAG: molybdate ABC transporter permease subunit [Desulfitobacteriaceae bacterium]
MDLFPLYLSLKVALFATLFGLLTALPLSWWFVEHSGRMANLLNSITNLPLVLPPTVLGYYLLVLVGRKSGLGRFYEHITGQSLVFSWQGAVLAAGIVSFPLLVSSLRNAMNSIPPNLVNAARLLGRSNRFVFFTIVLPLSWRGIISGVALAFARAMGDFGATLMVAGNIPGRTETMSIAVYDALMAGKNSQANLLSAIMTFVSLGFLLLIYRLEQRVHSEHERSGEI